VVTAPSGVTTAAITGLVSMRVATCALVMLCHAARIMALVAAALLVLAMLVAAALPEEVVAPQEEAVSIKMTDLLNTVAHATTMIAPCEASLVTRQRILSLRLLAVAL
jgi:hypothetical protein